MTTTPTPGALPTNLWWSSAYDQWLVDQDVPVHSGYFVEDVRELELGPWSLRGCNAAVLNLVGHQGVTEARLLEIPPGGTLPPFRMGQEEAIYVVEGQGLTNVWAEGHDKVSFEWQKHSLFRLPSNHWYELSNTRGDQRALTLHVSYLPLAMSLNPNPEFFFNNPYADTREMYGDATGKFYAAEAYAVMEEVQRGDRISKSEHWYANFFPDLTVWDRLRSQKGDGKGSGRGGGSMSAGISFPHSGIRTGMMALPALRYKKAHRHGPGVTILGVTEGDGFALMWPEGGEKIVCPWREGSLFVPPNNWYHQHFNSGAEQNRQLRVFPPRAMMAYNMPDNNRQIEYVDEDPWIRAKFNEELKANGLDSRMPDEAYVDPDYLFEDSELEGD